MLRILALTKDDKLPYFIDENNRSYVTWKELVDFLGRPHSCVIKVKEFNYYRDCCDVENYSEEQASSLYNHMTEEFTLLPYSLSFTETFNLLWEAAKN